MSRRAMSCLLLFAPLLLLSQPSPRTTGYTIAGRVSDAQSGAPLAGAEVAVAPVEHRDSLSSVITAPAGEFAFTGLAPGKYSLQALRRGFLSEAYKGHEGYSTAIVVGPNLHSANLTFPLHAPGAIVGIIKDQDGEPVPGAQVCLFEQQIRNGMRGVWLRTVANSNNDGSYRLAAFAVAPISSLLAPSRGTRVSLSIPPAKLWKLTSKNLMWLTRLRSIPPLRRRRRRRLFESSRARECRPI